ncbi:MAG: FAD-binding protein [Acidimicrobiia bacterium]
MSALRIAALIKQIPKFEAMELGPDGRLVREGIELEMNPYCRRAVAQAVSLVQTHGGSVTVVALGPPAAEDSVREAVAWGLERDIAIDGVLVTDAAFAGSDTLATARALAATIEVIGPFDLVIAGRNSVDADTGQVPPELAELLDLPFLTGVRHLAIDPDGLVHARCELDDGWLQAEVRLPALVSTAERLIDPCKVDPEGRAAVPATAIRHLHATDLGSGPWGQAGSPTTVGRVRVLECERLRHRIPAAPLDEQIRRAVEILSERGALDGTADTARDVGSVPASAAGAPDRVIGVLVEEGRGLLTRELLGTAATIAGRVIAIAAVSSGSDDPDPDELGGWGADEIVTIRGIDIEEDVGTALTGWVREATPWAVLAPGTVWGREVASRAAAALGAGLTGDAVALELEGERLVAWKPAFGGALVAAVVATSDPQLVTVRAGMLPQIHPRAGRASVVERAATTRGRVHLLARTRDDDIDVLADAHAVVGVGQGVPPEEYAALDPLLAVLGAELAATRKVTDQGWLPRARQLGITGRSIAPRLYVALGLSGKFNHMVGVRAAGTVVAVNDRPDALVFDAADVGIVGDWREVLPLLVAAIVDASNRTRVG